MFHFTAQLSLGSNNLMGTIPVEVTRLTFLCESISIWILVAANVAMLNSNVCLTFFILHVQIC
jgi:hypothetical protein